MHIAAPWKNLRLPLLPLTYTSTGCEVLVFGGARAEAKCELGTVSQRRHDRFIQQFHAVGSVPQEAPLVPATRSKKEQGAAR